MNKDPMRNDNKLKLGTFSANCSSGMAVTKVPERWENNWDNNLELVKQCDEAGIEFMLPIARWIGYGGETNFHGNVLETVTWAAGLVAHSQNIQVFATIHTAFNHPIVSAKQLATLDQLSGGRIGLNVVAGWNKPEYDAFGIELPSAHGERYKMAQEWFDYVSKLWTEDSPFDWEGDFFRGKDVCSLPHPVQERMPILNAAASEEGRNFISVPLSLDLPITFKGFKASPFLNSIKYFLPSLLIINSNFSDRAFTTDTPTPCKPPETLYES